MFEIIPDYVIIIIFSFLDKFSLQKYDSAMTSKSDRKYYLSTIKLLKISNPCRWSYLRGVQGFDRQICKFNNINYVSKYCTDLIIYGNYSDKNYKTFYINNENIKKLRIDLYSKNIQLFELYAKNLEELYFVRYVNININVLKNISKNCPKLKKINFICPICIIYNEEQIKKLINTDKIEVKIKK